MICDPEIKKVLERLHACDLLEGAQRVSTSCLYPDGGRVVVFIYKSHSGYVATDDGEAFETLKSCGIDTRGKFTRLANETANSFGMSFNETLKHFYSPDVNIDQIGAAIVYLANCIQKFVSIVIDKRQLETEKDLSDKIDECLHANNLIPKNHIIRNYSLIGESGKSYEFSHAIIEKERTILIAPITNHHASIAPAYMKFSDVSHEHSDFKREAVISHASEWQATDISLIRSVVSDINYIEDNLKPFMKRYGYLNLGK